MRTSDLRCLECDIRLGKIQDIEGLSKARRCTGCGKTIEVENEGTYEV